MKFELEKYKALKIILQILPMWRLMREGWSLNPQVNYPDQGRRGMSSKGDCFGRVRDFGFASPALVHQGKDN